MFNFTSILKNTTLAVALSLPIVALGQSVGDFRSNGAVNFVSTTNWQRYDGTAWVAASAAPTSTDGVILIRGGHTAQVTSNVTLDQLSVDGILQVNNGFTLTLNNGAGDDLFVRNRLFFQATGVIAGAGQLVLGNQAIVQTANVGGLAASITSTNPILTAGASYWFNGTAAQSIGFTGFASLGNPLHFHFKNTAGITIDRNLTITGTLTANNNVPIIIGAGVTTFTANAIYNGGSFNNCVGATIIPAFTNSSWASPKGIYQSPDSSEPTIESSNIWTNSHKTTAHIYWLQSGSGNNRIVVLKAGSAVSPTAAVDNTTYTANTAFGSGTAIDGGFVVYNGAGSQVNVTGLTEGTTYHVAVFEYNQNCGTNRNYKIGSPLSTSFVASERPFITEWITTDGTLTIPTTGGGYNYTVSYRELPAGSPTVLTGQTGNCTLTGLNNGVLYEVSIIGAFPRIYFYNVATTEKAKIRNIKQWGSIQWTSMQNAFGATNITPYTGCTNLNSNATDVPNLNNVTSTQEMFHGCSVFDGGNIGNWNVQNVTNMSYMFSGATIFNQNIGFWNVYNVNSMNSTFIQSSAFNQNIGNWNTAQVTITSSMFYGALAFNQPINNWNLISVSAGMGFMFYGALTFNQDISKWDTSNNISFSQMFNQAVLFDQNLANWNINNVISLNLMLNNCGMNIANYDATLIGWAAQGVQIGLQLGAVGRVYSCSVAPVRQSLITGKGWTITGDTGDCISNSVTALPAFSSCSGVASVAQSYTVSGSNLTADIVITAPTNFEVSVTSATAGFANSQTLTQSGGNVGNTTVYIRQKSTAPNGASGMVTQASTGMLTKNVSIPVSTVITGCPTISSFTPSSGGIDTRITLTGTGFTAGSVVAINGTPVRRLWYYSSTIIVVQVGDNTTTGKISVGASVSTTNFTVLPCVVATGVSATTTNSGGQAAITVNWTNPSAVNRVDVLYRIAGSPLPPTGAEFSRVITGLNSAGSQSFNLIGLNANTNYEVFVHTRCDGSTWSNWVSAGTVASGTANICTKPTITSPANNTTLAALQLPLTWSAIPNAISYQVVIVEVDGATPPIPVPSTSQLFIFTTNSGIVHFSQPNRKYRVLVRANCDTGGFGEYNDYFYITTGTATACLPSNTFPTVTYATGTGNLADATLSWSGASGTSGSPAYEVQLMLPDGITIHTRNTDATSLVWAGLNGNQTYQYRVRTFCANGNASLFSAWQPFTVPNTYGNCGTSITTLNLDDSKTWGAKLSWLPNNSGTNNPESNGRSYWVQYWNTSSPTTIYTIAKDSSKIQLLVGVHQGLVTGQQYTARVAYLCNGNLQTHSPTQTFQLLGSVADGSSNISSLAGISVNTNLHIYPNPAKQVAVISYQAPQPPTGRFISLIVVDVLGREVYRETSYTLNLQTNLNVSKLATGVYLVKVQDGEQTATKRLVVE